MFGVLRLVAAAVAVMAVAGEVTQEDLADGSDHDLTPSEARPLRAQPENRKRFLGVSSTTTYTAVVMVTSTVFTSCVEGTSAAVCAGRRKRRNLRSDPEIQTEKYDQSGDLSSSQEDLTQGDSETSHQVDDRMPPPDASPKDPKLFLTIWTVSRTTSTVTMLFTNTSTTISLSFYCQAGFQQLPSAGCGRR